MSAAAAMLPTTTFHPRPRGAGGAAAATSTSTFTLRPGVYGDMPAFAHAYYASFTDDRPGASDDNLMDVLFGDYRKFANETKRLLAAMLTPRLWDLQYRMSALVEDETGDVVGFVCFKRPKCEISFYERWISPTTWLNTLYSVLYSVKSSIAWFLAPPDPASLDPERAASFGRAFVDLEPRIRCSARRRAAWYLSIVAVDPSYQGLGLGGAMVRAVLDHVDNAGARQPLRTPNDAGRYNDDGAAVKVAAAAAAARCVDKEKENWHNVEVGGPAVWLSARRGTEGLYRKFGFVKVMESNEGPLAEWNGGAIMFRGLEGVEDMS